MKSAKYILAIWVLLFGLTSLSACGQKGPLEIERAPTVQEEELEETI